MAFIRKHNILNEIFFQILTEHDNILLDYHSAIYGKNHRQPSFNSPPKPLKFIVKCVKNINQLFVTCAESPGCFFFEKSVKIYCTSPVYEQMLIKYEEYSKLSVTYDENSEVCDGDISSEFILNNEKYKVFSIEDFDVEVFKKRIHFISYNEVIRLYSADVIPVQPGTFLGWANYKIVFGNSKVLYYLTTYSEKTRFSSESAKIEGDYLIINKKFMKSGNDLDLYSKLLRNFCIKSKETRDNTLVIPLPVETLFIETLLHSLSVVHHYNIPIFVVSPVYKKVELLVNIQSEWLNSSVCMSGEPFPIREYPRLYPIEILNYHYKESGESNNKIIFCSDIIYNYKTKNKIFKKQLDILVNYRYDLGARKISDDVLVGLEKRFESESFHDAIECNIKIESSLEEIKSLTKAVVISEDSYFFPTSAEYCYMNIDGRTGLLNNKLFVTGDFLFTDKYMSNQFKIYIRNKKSILKKLIEQKNYIAIGDSIIFPTERIKCKILSDDKIEYEIF